MSNQTIKCPNCKSEFAIGSALSQEIEAEIRTKYLKVYNEDKLKLAEKEAKNQEEKRIKRED